MRFFLDENMQYGMTGHLVSIFGPHEFMDVRDLGVKGADDLNLFPMVAKSGCHAFVTGDLAQLRRKNERDACRDAGLHWIGVAPVNAKGYHAIAGPASTLVHALPFVFDCLAELSDPQFFLLKKSERNNTQVFRSTGTL